jgi:L-rhamnose mutarotase
MTRRAFTLRLKPGALDEYVRQHDAIWPDLVAELRGQGVRSLTIFERDGDLFVFCEATDYEAMDRVWDSDVHGRWAGVMAPLIGVDAAGRVDAVPLAEIWHLDTGSAAD